MSHLVKGARSAVTGRASRAVVVGGTVVSAVSTAAGHERVGTWWSTLDSSRWWEAGLLCVGLVAALEGATLVSSGATRRWWVAGAHRDEVLVWGLVRSIGAALVVITTWVIVALAVVLVRWGPPSNPGGSPAVLIRTVAGFGMVAVMAHLIGAAVGRPWAAVALVAAATLPFSSESLDLLPTLPGWAAVASPIASSRAVVGGGTGNALASVDVSKGPLALAAGAAVAWAVGLGLLAHRRPLVASPRDRRSWLGKLPVPFALGAVGLLGAAGPTSLAGRVPWMLQPDWRDARAHGRSATQVAEKWLRCHAGAGSCRRFEVPAGVEVGDGARLVLSRQHDIEVSPDVEQNGPGTVDAVVEVGPVRSGRVLIRHAAVRVILVSDGNGWHVLRLLGPVAVMQP